MGMQPHIFYPQVFHHYLHQFTSTSYSSGPSVDVDASTFLPEFWHPFQSMAGNKRDGQAQTSCLH